MNNKHLIFLLLIILSVFNFSCKSTKIGSTGTADFNLSAKQLIRENTNKTPRFKTLAARVKINYVEGDKSQSTTVSLRMEKDKAIWMSKMSFIKVLITPNRVAYYNKLDNTYFDGDYTYLSDLLGTELDFNKVQNLLLGEALYDLKDQSYEVSVHQEAYLLQPKKKSETLELFYLLSPSHFKMTSQQLSQPETLRLLQIDYLAYQEVGKQSFPEMIKVNAVEGDTETVIELGFKNIALNEALRFPFKIPSGFEKIELQ